MPFPIFVSAGAPDGGRVWDTGEERQRSYGGYMRWNRQGGATAHVATVAEGTAAGIVIHVHVLTHDDKIYHKVILRLGWSGGAGKLALLPFWSYVHGCEGRGWRENEDQPPLQRST